jgi:hypothetical protein
MSNKEKMGAVVTEVRDGSWSRRRWSLLALPLLCGLIVAVCLVLLPFRSRAAQRATFLTVGAVAVLAGAVELNRSNSLCQRGLIEVRSVRFRGEKRLAFLIPFCPHFLAMGLLLVLFLDALSFNLLIVPWLDPGSFRHPSAVMLLGAFSMPIGLLGTVRFLHWTFVTPPGLAFLPEGLLLSNGRTGRFVAWDWMEQVARVKQRSVVVLYSLGLRLTDVDELPLPASQRRWVKYSHRSSGWHCLWPLWWHTLPLPQVVFLVKIYRQNGAEQAKIGSEEGLAYLRSRLAFIASHQATAQSPASAYP